MGNELIPCCSFFISYLIRFHFNLILSDLLVLSLCQTKRHSVFTLYFPFIKLDLIKMEEYMSVEAGRGCSVKGNQSV